MNPVFIQLGPLNITYYALFIVSALLLGIFLAKQEAAKQDISTELIYDYAFYLIIFAFIGARLWYFIFELSNYNSIFDIFKVYQGGLAIHGGILAGLLFTIYYTKKNNILFFKLTDIIVFPLILGQAIGRWGNFINQEAHGPVTSKQFLSNTLHLPDFIVNGMYIDGQYYHPTFLYESLWNIIGFIIMIFLRKKYRFNYGILSAFYLMWYGFIRTLIEILRTDALTLYSVKVAQISSIFMFICGLLILVTIARRKNV
ncbi:MAG: prolipoprotein diacylglyceryl transferase [Mycoplasmatales bacterium]